MSYLCLKIYRKIVCVFLTYSSFFLVVIVNSLNTWERMGKQSGHIEKTKQCGAWGYNLCLSNVIANFKVSAVVIEQHRVNDERLREKKHIEYLFPHTWLSSLVVIVFSQHGNEGLLGCIYIFMFVFVSNS